MDWGYGNITPQALTLRPAPGFGAYVDGIYQRRNRCRGVADTGYPKSPNHLCTTYGNICLLAEYRSQIVRERGRGPSRLASQQCESNGCQHNKLYVQFLGGSGPSDERLGVFLLFAVRSKVRARDGDF